MINRNMFNWVLYCICTLILLSTPIQTKSQEKALSNKEERLDWLKNAGFGMFIHWSLDSQLGSVISHSLVGTTNDYVNRYFHDLPKTFNPKKYDPEEWVVLAKLAGMKYVVLTTKHHSGFCLWDTKTTDFNIMNTPYGKDIVAEYVQACRKHDMAVGFYFSPDDFWYLDQNNIMISRHTPESSPKGNEKFTDYLKAQVRELMTQYGKIDVMFFDGRGSDPLKELCWQINPDLLITRGAIRTPEQALLGIATDKAWEACVTMGTQWQYKANEKYKSASRLIEILIQTRAKGGSLLLNVGPKPDGELPIEQEERLREISLWHFTNQEAVQGVRPWIITNENNIWYSRKGNTVYAYLTGLGVWDRGDRKSFVLKTIKSTDQTQIEVVGQSGKHIEGRHLNADIKPRWSQEKDGLHVSVVRAYRLFNDSRWHNPVVIKVTNAKPALDPPVVQTTGFETVSDNTVELTGNLLEIGDSESVQAGFQYRLNPAYGDDLYTEDWLESNFITLKQTGEFSLKVLNVKRATYQYRTVVKHPLITIKGNIERFRAGHKEE